MIVLPQLLTETYTETFCHIFHRLKSESSPKIILKASKVKAISPGGQALLACLSDMAIEHKATLQILNLNRRLYKIPSFQILKKIKRQKGLPHPKVYDQKTNGVFLSGQINVLNLSFIEDVIYFYQNIFDEEQSYTFRLLINELMQNSIDHSGAERYYLFAGEWQNEFHTGLLDMGVSIPAKLAQRYSFQNDIEALSLSLKPGISTRRQRQGGFGLSHVLQCVKNQQGKFTLMSRDAQIRYYFANNKVYRKPLKYSLPGTWCFVRWPFIHKKGRKK